MSTSITCDIIFQPGKCTQTSFPTRRRRPAPRSSPSSRRWGWARSAPRPPSSSSSSTCGRTHGADVTDGSHGGGLAQHAWVRAHARGQSVEGDRRSVWRGRLSFANTPWTVPHLFQAIREARLLRRPGRHEVVDHIAPIDALALVLRLAAPHPQPSSPLSLPSPTCSTPAIST